MIGQFRDLDQPGRFVWLRGFSDMASREAVLVGLAVFADGAAHEAVVRSGAWAREVQPTLDRWLARPAERLRLVPTSRSAIHAC